MIYTYKCKCGFEKEVNHPMDENPDVFCDDCAGTMQRKLGNMKVLYKGHGFHCNDYQ